MLFHSILSSFKHSVLFKYTTITAASAITALTAASCGGDDELPDRCKLVVWYRPVQLAQQIVLPHVPAEAEHAVLVGSYDNWTTETHFERRDGGDGADWRRAELTLPPGKYNYALRIGDELFADPNNSRGTFIQNPFKGAAASPFDTEVSLIEIPDCAAPAFEFTSARQTGDGELTFEANFSGGKGLDKKSVQSALTSGTAEQDFSQNLLLDIRGGKIRAVASGLPAGKYNLTLSAGDKSGTALNPIRASAFVESDQINKNNSNNKNPKYTHRTLDDVVIYHVMVDRFWGDNGPLAPPETIGLRAGGTLSGVRQMVEAGYFNELGVTTLWISPVMENPAGIFRGRDGHDYEAYHGYWWLNPRAVEPAFGGEEALDRLIDAAHQKNLRVVLDVVPNHLFQEHPYVQAHSRLNESIAQSPDVNSESWFNDDPNEVCVCGFTCPWAGHMETCWFDDYLLDINQRNGAARQAIIDDLLWWHKRFDLDGVRVDAVPMMPRAATRDLLRQLRNQTFREGIDGLMLGEIFTGGDDGGRTDIRFYLGPGVDGLDSAYDFPLMWSLRNTFGTRFEGLEALESALARNNSFWGTSGSRLSLIAGNHDTSRFISDAMGFGGNDAWKDPPPQPVGDDGAPYYNRLYMALAYNFSLPGIPVLYYGDEIGMAGANDPDCRRVLPDVLTGNGLDISQVKLLEKIRRVSAARASSPAIRRGKRVLLYAQGDLAAAAHLPASDFEQFGAALTAFNRAEYPNTIQLESLDTLGIDDGTYRDALTGRYLTIRNGKCSVELAAESAGYYLREE